METKASCFAAAIANKYEISYACQYKNRKRYCIKRFGKDAD